MSVASDVANEVSIEAFICKKDIPEKDKASQKLSKINVYEWSTCISVKRIRPLVKNHVTENPNVK